MSTPVQYVQSNTFYLAGSGVIQRAVTAPLTNFSDIYGNILTMASFGVKGYGTAEPDTSNEEGFTFTSVTANANGTYTLGGISSILAQSPYTESSGFVRNHAGGSEIVISDNVAFWNTFANKANDETVSGQWTFTNTPIVPGVVSDASTTVKGVSKLSVAALLSTNPIVAGTNDPRIPVGFAVDAVGTDAYAITPSPAITAYTAGQIVTFQAGTANTGAATLNVNALGAKTIKKDVSSDLATGDILLNQIVNVIYDGTNFQMMSRLSTLIPVIYSNGIATKATGDASTTQTIAHGLGRIPKKVRLTATYAPTNSILNSSIGTYDGTHNTSVLWSFTSTYSSSTSTTFAIFLSAGGATQTGVVTFDATNINIAWTLGGGSGNTVGFMWEAEG